MAPRRARPRVTYVLPLANSPGGHRLGVNSLAVDCDQSILYSAGRDGVICAWNVDLPLHSNPNIPHVRTPNAGAAGKTTSFRDQAQAHTHWVNDIILSQSNEALVSASSDITVKIWRPHARDGQLPSTIGTHDDYVKCIASPGVHSDWVASGGLDHKIRIWDLNGGGQKLEIDATENEGGAKGSVYALSVRGSIMASGGPESILRLWDPRSGKRITKFVGHTDNIRDILINESGDMVMTASSDQTVKIWSMAAGRCVNTLTMHNDSVWCLYSDHPQLSVFYSGDRSGLVAKTDVRGSPTMDEGISVAIAQEHAGVNKLVVGGKFIWTATSSSSINRWRDIDTTTEIQVPESPRQNRLSSLVNRPKVPSPPATTEHVAMSNSPDSTKRIPLASVLKISNTVAPRIRDLEASTIRSGSIGRKGSEVFIDIDNETLTPIYNLPEETIEGQNGLIKHCVPIKSYEKRHLDDVTPEVNTQERVENWCTVDTRTGRLAVALEENYCFDAEMYADETDIDIEFREDQRINLGKWVLRYLFANLIDEEIKRDEAFRAGLRRSRPAVASGARDIPRLGALPPNPVSQWSEEDSAITPRPTNGTYPTTPGLAIGVVTPSTAGLSAGGTGGLSSGPEESNELKKTASGNSRTSGDYFSNPPPPPASQNGGDKTTNNAEALQSSSEPEKDAKSSSLFGKKFRMFPKLGRTSTEASKPAIEEEKAEESDKSSEKDPEKTFEDNLSGVIQKIRSDYHEILQATPEASLVSGITPSLPSDTPVLKLPPHTTIIIQEDRPESGGIEDLYRGTVQSVGRDADLIEKIAPTWVGELLLKNQTPTKDIVKVAFVLTPWQDMLPSIAGPDGNSRLNANRMLRAKKILGYVTERIDPPSSTDESGENALKPEEYLDLYCQKKRIDPDMTLATIKAYVWKGTGDVVLYYKSNGRKPELERKAAEIKAQAELDAAKGAAAADDNGGAAGGRDQQGGANASAVAASLVASV